VCVAGQFNEATSDATHALEFLKHAYSDDLGGYDGDSVQYIVAVLRERYPFNSSSYPSAAAEPHQLRNHAWRHGARQNASSKNENNNNNNRNSYNNNSDGARLFPSLSFAATNAAISRHSVTTATPDVATGDDVAGLFDAAAHDDEYANVGGGVLGGAIPANSSGTETKSNNRSSGVPPASYFENNSYAERLLEIAHIFHFVSIAILGIFVIQVRSRDQYRYPSRTHLNTPVSHAEVIN